MIPTNTSRSKRDHSAGYETWIIHHGSSIMDHVSREQPCLKMQVYTNRFREHQGECVVAVIRFCLGIQRKITTALEFIAILVSDDCKNDVTKRVITGCNDLRNATRASINLTETFQQCCNEAEECVLPKHFYNVSCREHISASCAKNGSQINFTAFALSQI